MKLPRLKLLLASTLLAFGLLTFSSMAQAAVWNDLVPGLTKRADVLVRLGQPTKEMNRGGVYTRGLLYQGIQAPEGTRQVQVFFDAQDTVYAIHVFPKADLSRDQIKKNYGTDYEEKLTDAFKTYFFFRKLGLVVYFQEGNQTVNSLTYQKGEEEK